MYCDIFPYGIVVAYFCSGLFSFEFKILRYCTYDCSWENCVPVSHTSSVQQCYAVHEDIVVAYYNIFVYETERTDFAIFSYFSFRIDECQWTYLTHYIIFLQVGDNTSLHRKFLSAYAL